MLPKLFNWRLMIMFGIVFVVAISIGWLAAKRGGEKPVSATEENGTAGETRSKVAAHLYFSDPQGRHLVAEQRIFDRPKDDAAFGRQLIEALIEGPRQNGSRTLPSEAALSGIYVLTGGVSENDTAVVDLDAQALEAHPGGVKTELLSIYSIVNTLVFNMNAIRSVKILIGGREAQTLAGHVDLSHSFVADMMWVR